jgi:hypothetical protein
MDVRRRAAFAVAAVIIVAGIVMKSQRNVETATQNGTVIATGTTGSGSVAPPPRPAPDAAPTFAERILADYGDAARPPEEDMRAVARTLDNFSLLVKGDNPLPLGANEEIAAALRGKNKAGLRALPGDHRILDAQGRLIDRWGTPLYFHAQSRDRLEIRSAGPDRAMWTADDLHRKHDGRFLRGEELLAPSLFDEKSNTR